MMPRNYYYFMASLPVLFFGKKPSLSVDEYLRVCAGQLHPQDARAVLCAVQEDPAVTGGVAAAWCAMRHSLKNELAHERALRAGKKPFQYVRGAYSLDPFARATAISVLNILDPLEAQQALDRSAWQFLDELQSGHYFDTDSAVIYGLKLKILQRHEDIVSSKGAEVFVGYLQDDRLAAVAAAVNS